MNDTDHWNIIEHLRALLLEHHSSTVMAEGLRVCPVCNRRDHSAFLALIEELSRQRKASKPKDVEAP